MKKEYIKMLMVQILELVIKKNMISSFSLLKKISLEEMFNVKNIDEIKENK